MSKITEYTSASTFDANDVLLKDGENGTMIISVEDAASEFRRLSGVDDDISGNTQAITQAMGTINSNIAGVETDYIASKDYAIGDLFVVNNVLYKATAAIAEEDIIDTETNCAVVNLGGEIGDIRAELTNKANVDGSYDELTAGSSKQLLGTVFIEDDEPYLFRTSGGSIDIGDREYDEIVGGSIVWNQMIRNGNFADGTTWSLGLDTIADLAVANNIATVTMRADHTDYSAIIKTDDRGIAGHVIFSAITVNPSRDTSVMNMYTGLGDGLRSIDCPADSWTVVGNIIRLKSDVISMYYFDTGKSLKENDTVQFKNAVVFDLTQMLGSEIADYIYNLEQATPGAGVAWFRKYFPKDYYEYNAGELMHVTDLQSHDMVGFNLWDEEWEVGDISPTTGQNVDADTIRTKNYIPVIPGTTYFAHIGGQTGTNLKTRFYDVDKNYIGTTQKNGNTVLYNNTFTVPDNAHYMRFATQVAYGTTYNHDISINLSWDGERDGEYEPYVKHSYPLDSSLTLRGIPKLSTDGKLYYDGDHYKSDGTVERRYGIVDLGTLEWVQHGGVDGRWTSGLPNAAKATSNYSIKGNAVCGKYENIAQNKLFANTQGIATHSLDGTMVFVYDPAYTDAATFKAAMSGVYLVYELAEPTTEEAQPFQSPQIVDDFGTEEYITSSIVPVGHTTQYDSNLRAKLEMAPNSPDSDGDYLVRQTSGHNEYVPYTDGGRITALEGKIPAAPSVNGSYILKCTVTDDTATYAWVAE